MALDTRVEEFQDALKEEIKHDQGQNNDTLKDFLLKENKETKEKGDKISKTQEIVSTTVVQNQNIDEIKKDSSYQTKVIQDQEHVKKE